MIETRAILRRFRIKRDPVVVFPDLLWCDFPLNHMTRNKRDERYITVITFDTAIVRGFARPSIQDTITRNTEAWDSEQWPSQIAFIVRGLGIKPIPHSHLTRTSPILDPFESLSNTQE